MYYAVIMAGGSGTRLWPLSRNKHPKQAVKIIGERTMFQHACDRLFPLFNSEQIFVVTRAEHVDLLSSQVPSLPKDHFIIEPEGRGTAPAIGLAAIHLLKRDPQAIMAVLTADHYIKNIECFRDALIAAYKAASNNYLVTLGIMPTHPATGYGYIKQDSTPLGEVDDFILYKVDRFVEKPNIDRAKKYIEEGGYYWNSGMFIWKVERILEEFKQQMPEFYLQICDVEKNIYKENYSEKLQSIWPTVTKQSIDYGIMEGAKDVTVIPVDMGWTDIGSWGNLLDLLPRDNNGNTIIGDGITLDTSDTMIFGGKRLIATIGVEGYIIVDTDDALLICPKEREQDVREIVKALEDENRRTWL